MESKDAQTLYWTGGIVLAIVVVLAVVGYVLGWYTAPPGQP